MKHLIAAVLLLMCGSVQAATITIDFEEPGIDYGAPGSMSGFYNGPVTTRGFQISYICPAEPCDDIFVEGATLPGETTILAWGANGTVTVEALNLLPFDLVSMDLGTAYGGDYSVLGHYAAGGTVQVDLFVADLFVLNNILFDAAWSGLVSVDLIMPDGPGVADNIVINQVPIPAAVWLFGSGLAGLGFLRRKKS